MSCEMCELDAGGSGPRYTDGEYQWYLARQGFSYALWASQRRADAPHRGALVVVPVTHCPWCGRELKGEGE